MRTYRWWRKQRKRVQKKYTLILGSYLSPRELREWHKRWTGRKYPKALSYKGQLTNEQFCEIEKECDIDFCKLVGQDIRFTIRYKRESEDKE